MRTADQLAHKQAYAFFFHYNKPASLAAGRPQLSVHYRGVCHIVDDVIIDVPTRSRKRATQPRCVIVGRARQLQIADGVAHLK